MALVTAPHLTICHAQPLPKSQCEYSSLGLNLVTGISTDGSMHFFQVLPDPPGGQPFLRLVSIFAFSQDCRTWATSPDGCFVLLCHLVSCFMQHLVVYDLESAVEIRSDTLHSSRVDKIIWW